MSGFACWFMGFFLICCVRVLPAAEGVSDIDPAALRDARAASAEFYYRGQAGRIVERLATIRTEGDRGNRRNWLGVRINRPQGVWQIRRSGLNREAPAAVVESINLTHLGAVAPEQKAEDFVLSGGRSSLTAPKAPTRWSRWNGGAADFGASGRAEADTHNLCTTFGADYAFGAGVTAGIAAGYARDWNRVGAGGRLGGEALSAAAYASYVFEPGIYLEGMAGGNVFCQDLRREDGNVMPPAGGGRGEQLFGYVSLGYEFGKNSFTISPFTRFESVFSRFPAWAPPTAPGAAAAGGEAGQYSAVFGVVARRSLAPAWGELHPSAGLEYGYNFKGGGYWSADAAAGGGAFSRVSPFTADGTLSATAGIEARFRNRFRLGLHYRGVLLPDAALEQSLSLEGGWSF